MSDDRNETGAGLEPAPVNAEDNLYELIKETFDRDPEADAAIDADIDRCRTFLVFRLADGPERLQSLEKAARIAGVNLSWQHMWTIPLLDYDGKPWLALDEDGMQVLVGLRA
jgi:hypothetical protein